MPVISYEAGPLSPEQKKELITQLTDVAAEITKIPKHSFTILIKELPLENIGVGGQDLITLFKEREAQS